ncbi:MAG: tetratricopeptide repeat protein [Vicinamibacterales bacterium]
MLLIACAAMAASPAVPQAPTPGRAEAYYLFLHARQLEGEGDVQGAIAAHRRAAALAPEAAELRAELAGLFARQNRGDDALVEAQAALALDPDNREAHRILGFVFAARVDNDPAGDQTPAAIENARKAAAHFEKARAGRPGDPASELTLGRLYVITGEFDRAISILNGFLLDQPGYTEAILLLSDAYAGKGQTGEAIAALEHVIREAPEMTQPAIRLAEMYEADGQWQKAADLYARLIAGTPRMAAVLRPRRATALVNAGRIDEARAILRELTQASPGDAGLWYLASQAELRAGMLGDAEQAARRIIAIDPNDPRGAAALADVLVARREFPRALETLQPWIDRGAAGGLSVEADEMIAPRAAHVLGALGRHDRAVEVLERLSRRVPGDVDVKFELGAAFDRARRHADAERVFREIVLANPSHALALNYLGYMLANRGERLEEAVSLIERALAIEPGNPSYEDSLGWAYYRLKRYDLAERHLARAAGGAVTSSVVQDHYGDVLFALKRYGHAIAAWQKALSGDRDDVDVSQIEKKIALAKEIAR